LKIQRIGFALNKDCRLFMADMDTELASTGISSSHIDALLLLSAGIGRMSVCLSRLLGADAEVVKIIEQNELATQVKTAQPVSTKVEMRVQTRGQVSPSCGMDHQEAPSMRRH